MTNDTFTISAAQLRQIARYEITFKDIFGDAGFHIGNIVCPEPYSYSLEDLHQALKNLQASDPLMEEFGKDWFYPITQLSDAFGFPQIYASIHDPALISDAAKTWPGLQVTDGQWFVTAWRELDHAWTAYTDSARLSDMLGLDLLLADLDQYFENREKPVPERTFPVSEMKAYIKYFYNNDFVKDASEDQLSLARRFIDAFCEQEDTTALDLKGYACYGGSALYPCDWEVSRDCILRLFELTDDPQYANTLGYIYYYGRCSDGVPEYDKAFYYFGIAAANGLYEGMYKLADMFRQGYGCKQSPRTARSLYGMVYDDSILSFLRGQHANFADAALRMGIVFEKGIHEEIDLPTAYRYYLQAEYAAALRAQDSDFFGNIAVVKNAREALERVHSQLPEDFFAEHADYDLPYAFADLAAANHKCQLSRSVTENDAVMLTAKRIPTRSVPAPDSILITISRRSYCRRTLEASFTLSPSARVWFLDDADTVFYDSCSWSVVDSRYEFYLNDTLVAWSDAENYRFCEIM